MKKIERSTTPTLEAEEIEKMKQAHWESFVEDSAKYLARLDEEYGTVEDHAAAPTETEELYCVACRRKFKTQSQWENHEKSKKHQAIVARLRKELLLEGEEDPLAPPTMPPSQDEVDVDQFLEEQEILARGFQNEEQQREEGEENNHQNQDETQTQTEAGEEGTVEVESEESTPIDRRQPISSPPGTNKKQKKKLQKMKARKKIIHGSSSSDDDEPEPIISPVLDSSDEDTPKGGRKTRRRRKRNKN